MTGARLPDPDICCVDCPVIDGLWPRMQLARSILQHRPPNAATVAMALEALDGKGIEQLCRETPAAPGPSEVS